MLPPLVFAMFLVTMSTRVLGESCFPLGASDSGRGFNWHCASRRWQRHQKIAFVLVGSGSEQSHGRLVFFFAAKKKARQLERWPGCSAADNETCATFRRHSRRQGTEQSMQ